MGSPGGIAISIDPGAWAKPDPLFWMAISTCDWYSKTAVTGSEDGLAEARILAYHFPNRRPDGDTRVLTQPADHLSPRGAGEGNIAPLDEK